MATRAERINIDTMDQERRNLKHRARVEGETRRKEERYSRKHGRPQRCCFNCNGNGHRRADCKKTKAPPPHLSPRLKALQRLGLTGDQDTPVLIRAAYKACALAYHPDKNDEDTTAVFQSILAAYEFLRG